MHENLKPVENLTKNVDFFEFKLLMLEILKFNMRDAIFSATGSFIGTVHFSK